MDETARYIRYQELQSYVGWSDEHARLVHAAGSLVEPSFAALVDDFYQEIDRHPEARKVITGGQEQIERLKGLLVDWLQRLFSGRYDGDYVARRWQVGWRHVEIGLDQVYTNVALSRLRAGIVRALERVWSGDRPTLSKTLAALHTLLDLDLAIIEDAYQTEHLARQQRSERLATVGQVAAGMAHELRNPLNVVKTSIYYLLNARNPSPERVNDHLQRIERQVLLADGVITALTNFAKLPVAKLEPVSVASLVSQTLESNPLPPAIELAVDCPETLPLVLADAAQIQIALGNLIRNARDAMAGGGRLSLRATETGGEIEVAVADSGPGIAPENLSKVLEPFYSTKARGIGLGLAISRAILDKHKGSLRVTSEVGRGSTFFVRLSAASGTA